MRAATEADLLAQPPDGNKYELVDGAIRASPAGARHGNIAVRLAIERVERRVRSWDGSAD